MLSRWLAARRYRRLVAEAAAASGDAETSVATLERALEQARLAYGDRHGEVAAMRYALGCARLAAGDAEGALREARAIERHEAEEAVPAHRVAALEAAALERLDRPAAELEPALRSWAAAAERASDDDAIASANNQLGLLLGREGRREEADAAFAEAVARRRRSVGERDRSTLEVLYNRATFHAPGRPLGDARADLEQVVTALSREGGPSAPELLESALHNLGVLLEEVGEPDAARARLEEALARREARLGPRHASLRPTLVRLAQLHHRQDRIVFALPLYDRALASAREELGERSPVVRALEAWRAELTEGVGPTAIRR